jgi:hypothetical protein
MKLRSLLISKQNKTVLSPNFHIHVSVRDLYIPSIGLSILLQPKRQTNPGNMEALLLLSEEAMRIQEDRPRRTVKDD